MKSEVSLQIAATAIIPNRRRRRRRRHVERLRRCARARAHAFSCSNCSRILSSTFSLYSLICLRHVYLRFYSRIPVMRDFCSFLLPKTVRIPLFLFFLIVLLSL